MARRIFFKEGVFADFRKCNPDRPTDVKIRDALKTLKEKPEDGLPVPFKKPTLFYRISIELYRAHYIFNDREVSILYLGIPGKC